MSGGGSGQRRMFLAEHTDEAQYAQMFKRGGKTSFVTHNGKYNILLKWAFMSRLSVLYWRDRFHNLLVVKWWMLVCILFSLYVIWGTILALLTFLVTAGQVEECLGDVEGYLNYYWFAIETMFAVGYGSPRMPTCHAANWMVTFMAGSGAVLNSIVVGIVFNKFSDATKRRHSVAFSHVLVGGDIDASDAAMAMQTGLPAAGVSGLGGVGQATLIPPSTAPRASSMLPSLSEMDEEDGSPPPSRKSTLEDRKAESPLSPRRTLRPSQSFQVGRKKTLGGTIYPSTGGATGLGRLSVAAAAGASQPGIARMSSGLGAFGQMQGAESPPTQQMRPLEVEEKQHFSLTFRMMNLASSPFIDPSLTIYLLEHDPEDLMIHRFNRFFTNIPLEFLSLPVSVTVDSCDPDSPLYGLTPDELQQHGSAFELVVLLNLTDNLTSRTVEIRKSWKLDNIHWNRNFKNIIRRTGLVDHGAYEIDVDDFHITEEEDSWL